MKNKLKKVYNYFEENLIVIVASIAIFVSPFVVDYGSLPKGYELPKVHFLDAVAAIIIFLGVIKLLENIYKTRKIKITKDVGIFLAVVIVFAISSLVSPHLQISIYGNSFRDQGLITHLLIIGMAYVVYKSINRRNFHLVAVSFIASSLIESTLGYVQVARLVQTDPKSLLDGFWVNGTFGQANFFSGRLLMGLIFLAFYIGHNIKIKFAFIIKILLILSTLFIIGALLLSLSVWAIATAAAAYVTMLLYEFSPRKVFSYLFYVAVLIAAILGTLYIASSTVYNLRIEIWKAIVNLLFTHAEVKNTVFGYGLDTLGEGFKDWRYFKGVLIDRAHNFFFDILFQTGVIGLSFVVVIISKPLISLRKKIDDRVFVFAFFGLFFWLLRSFIHESGIVNLVDFLIVLGTTLALSKDDKKKKVEAVVIKESAELEIPVEAMNPQV